MQNTCSCSCITKFKQIKVHLIELSGKYDREEKAVYYVNRLP
ncbi:hypothetical protein BVRB_1g013780 [Beta vulgaris subsp. vulgaris]|nr:hypothetical protein BVRB_1g013780 [Beta vulgaris subsp. vulgaris]